MVGAVLLIVSIVKFADSSDMEPFIVGGRPAGVQSYSYSVFMTVDVDDQSFVCGASILNQNIIMSAAHCFEGFNRHSKVSVRSGSANKLRGSLRYASKLVVHMEYDPHTIENDIALAYLRKPFVLGTYVKRVIIMKRPPATNVAYVAGWGLIDESSETETDWLQLAKQTLWKREECKKVLRRVPTGILCGGARHSSEYAAEGDSGSALVINGSIQIGLVSFKRPEISRSIVVYTDVAYFYNWITATAVKLHCPY